MAQLQFDTKRFTPIVICWTVMMGIVGGILIDIENKRAEYEVHKATVIMPAQEIQIEVVIDWTPERIEQEIRNTFPETPNTAVAIAKAESELNPNALNPEAHKGCNGSYGIFQIACVHKKTNTSELKDIKTNLKKAREIYLKEGWKPWGAYTDKRYKQYL